MEQSIDELSFDEVYEAHFDFVGRSLYRLGVAQPSLEDAVQDVFVVVHRQLNRFEGRSSVKTWLYGIALKVARDARRRASRKAEPGPLPPKLEDTRPSPFDAAATSQAMAQLQRLLEGLTDEKREAYVLCELEQMSAPEAAATLGIDLTTVYSRVRAARAEVNEGWLQVRGAR